ncbi:MAG: AAA family ATPase [Chloroflexi bacterium]|nr:AAA family ATPase [Chloroflexota bacterium]
MRLTRIEIRNFRSIQHLDLELDKATVFIDPNNVDKTAGAKVAESIAADMAA